MLYIYPYFFSGTVELGQYNDMVERWKRVYGIRLNNQRYGLGAGIGVGYDAGLFEAGLSLKMLISSSNSRDFFLLDDYSNDLKLTHSLYNYLVNLHVGINYPITTLSSIYTGIKFIFGLSNLKYNIEYRQYDYNYEYDYYSWSKSSLNSLGLGLGIETRGEIYLSKNLAIFGGFGYDMIEFRRYEGEAEEYVRSRNCYYDGCYEDESWDTYPVYLVYDKGDRSLYPSSTPPNSYYGEEWGVEDLNGLRFFFGLRFNIF